MFQHYIGIIRIQESADKRIVIAGAGGVEAGFGIVIVAPVAEGVQMRYMVGIRDCAAAGVRYR